MVIFLRGGSDPQTTPLNLPLWPTSSQHQTVLKFCIIVLNCKTPATSTLRVCLSFFFWCMECLPAMSIKSKSQTENEKWIPLTWQKENGKSRAWYLAYCIEEEHNIHILNVALTISSLTMHVKMPQSYVLLCWGNVLLLGKKKFNTSAIKVTSKDPKAYDY